jgi:hypothetical protein
VDVVVDLWVGEAGTHLQRPGADGEVNVKEPPRGRLRGRENGRLSIGDVGEGMHGSRGRRDQWEREPMWLGVPGASNYVCEFGFERLEEDIFRRERIWQIGIRVKMF